MLLTLFDKVNNIVPSFDMSDKMVWHFLYI